MNIRISSPFITAAAVVAFLSLAGCLDNVEQDRTTHARQSEMSASARKVGSVVYGLRRLKTSGDSTTTLVLTLAYDAARPREADLAKECAREEFNSRAHEFCYGIPDLAVLRFGSRSLRPKGAIVEVTPEFSERRILLSFSADDFVDNSGAVLLFDDRFHGNGIVHLTVPARARKAG